MLPTEQLIVFPEKKHKIIYCDGGKTRVTLIFVKVTFFYLIMHIVILKYSKLWRELSRLRGWTLHYSPKEKPGEKLIELKKLLIYLFKSNGVIATILFLKRQNSF